MYLANLKILLLTKMGEVHISTDKTIIFIQYFSEHGSVPK